MPNGPVAWPINFTTGENGGGIDGRSGGAAVSRDEFYSLFLGTAG